MPANDEAHMLAILPEVELPLEIGDPIEKTGEIVLDSGMESTTVVSSGLLIIEGLKGANQEGTSKSQDAGPKGTLPAVAELSKNESMSDVKEQAKKLNDVRARILRERDERDKDLDLKREAELRDEWMKLIDKDLSVPGKPMKNPIPSRSGDPWGDWHRRLEIFDNGFCGLSKDEIDKMLVFSGLFSAALTAFAAVSFTWFDDPMDDVQTQASIHVSNQLANSTGTAPFTPKPFEPSASVIRINIFWFLSLVLSLGAVLIGIICLQWIREYQRDVTHTSYQTAIAIRQIRYEGYQKWHVSRFVNTVPLLLHLSVILFFAGVFDLLLDRKPLIAYIVLVPMVVVVGIFLLTTILPTFQLLCHAFFPPTLDNQELPQAQCPYKSPQAWLFQRLVLTISGWLFSKNRRSAGPEPSSNPRIIIGPIEHDQGAIIHAQASADHVSTWRHWLSYHTRMLKSLWPAHSRLETRSTSQGNTDAQPSTDLETGLITESQPSARGHVLTHSVSTWRRWLPSPTGIFNSLMWTHNNTEPRDSADQDNIEQTQGPLVKYAKADSWSALDKILHQDNTRAGSADKYFCRAWFWSRENACQSKEAYFDLLSCYSELDSGSIGHILTKEPDVDPTTMSKSQRKRLHWAKQGTAKELYEGMISAVGKREPTFAVLKGVPKEMALFCYLATKKAPDFIRTQLYAISYEIFDRLLHYSHGKYTSEIDVPDLADNTIPGTRATQQLLALYRQIAVLASSKVYDYLLSFDLPDSITSISDDQCQHCFREFGKYCLREGTSNDCTEEYRVRQMLFSVAFILKPGSPRQSTAIKRLGDVLWEVSLDAVEYAYILQDSGDPWLPKYLEEAKEHMISTLRSGMVDFTQLKEATVKRLDGVLEWKE